MQTPTSPQPRDQDFRAADDANTATQRLGLIRKASVLVKAIGTSNELAILSGTARHYQRQVHKDLPFIRLGLIFFRRQFLKVAYEAHAEPKNQSRVNEELPPVLGGKDHQAMADDLAGAKCGGPSAEIAAQRLPGRIKNMVFAIARKAYSTKKAVVKKVMEHDIIAFMLGNQTAIGAFLKASQGAVAGWIDALMQFLMHLRSPSSSWQKYSGVRGGTPPLPPKP